MDGALALSPDVLDSYPSSALTSKNSSSPCYPYEPQSPLLSNETHSTPPSSGYFGD